MRCLSDGWWNKFNTLAFCSRFTNKLQKVWQDNVILKTNQSLLCPTLELIHGKQENSHESPSKMLCPSTKSIRLIPMIMVFWFSSFPSQPRNHLKPAILLQPLTTTMKSWIKLLMVLFLLTLFLYLYLHPQILFIIFIQQIKIKRGRGSNSTMCFYLMQCFFHVKEVPRWTWNALF